MSSFSSVYTEPGGYSKFKATTSFPVIPGGFRVVAIIGDGITTKPVVGEVVTMTATATYALANTINSISAIVDASPYEHEYVQGTDYSVSGGGVRWLAATITVSGSVSAPTVTLNVPGTTFITSVNGLALNTVTFTATTSSMTQIAAWLNSNTGFKAYLTATAEASTSVLLVSTQACATINSSIYIGDGTSNSILGFVGGDSYLSPKRPTSAQLFYVDYDYTKATADYIPTYYFNLPDIISEYGDVSSTNTLSLGAELAFQNGAQVILGCQLAPADSPDLIGFRNALDKLKVKDCNIVVCMTGDVNVAPYIKAHVDQMSTTLERKERLAIIGLDGTISTTSIKSLAQALGDKRTMVVYPVTVRLTLDEGEVSMGSYTLAAAIAGIRTNPSYDVAEPLTHKGIVGFTEITDNLIRSQRNDLASNGVCIVESQSGVARVRHALSTDMSSNINKQFSVTETLDYVGQLTRQVAERLYVGTKGLKEAPLMLAATLTTVLQNLVDREIIVSFTSPTASFNSIDPAELDVRFGVSPVFPIDYVYIEFSTI